LRKSAQGTCIGPWELLAGAGRLQSQLTAQQSNHHTRLAALVAAEAIHARRVNLCRDKLISPRKSIVGSEVNGFGKDK
jgi:hypothetical protein